MPGPRAEYLYPRPAGWNAAMRATLVANLQGVSDADIIDDQVRNLTGKIDGVMVDALVITGVDLPFSPADILVAVGS